MGVGANPRHGTSSVIPSHVKGKQKRKKEAQDRKMIWSTCGLGVGESIDRDVEPCPPRDEMTSGV